MKNELAEAIDILKRLSEKDIGKALTFLREIRESSDKEEDDVLPTCIKCNGKHIVKNGHRSNKQAYLCRDCGKTFVETTNNTMYNSHFGEAVWKQIIRDTINGVPLDDTAKALDIHHETAFNIRHKILYCLEQEEKQNPTMLEGICEMDETYILESNKGKKFPPDYYRKPRNHESKAVKQGLSEEYICICAGVQRDGQTISKSVNRATAGKEDIKEVFSERISGKTVIISDGQKSYNVLEEDGECAIINAKEAHEHGADFFHMNTVNSYHSYIKEKNRNARGYATKYINRYNALFSKAFRSTDALVEDIYKLLCDRNDRSRTILYTQTQDLLNI